MTKEELEKEAVRYCTSNCGDCYGCHKKYRKNKNCERLKSMIKTYLASAEPREKQIQIDAEHIIALQKQNGELTDKVNDLEEKLANADYQLEGRDNEIRELEAQIKKMQNCRNCKNEKIEGACGHFTQVGWCRDWELAD